MRRFRIEYYDKKILIMFPAFMLAGTIFFNLTQVNLLDSTLFYEPEVLRENSFLTIFISTLLKRIKQLLIFFLASLTRVRKKIVTMLFAYFGFMVGIISAFMVKNYKIKYFPMFFTGILGHMIIYQVAVLGLLKEMQKYRLRKNIYGFLLFFMIYFIGILLECISLKYILPLFLR